MNSNWKKLDSKVVVKNKYWTYLLDKYAILNKNYEGEYHYVRTLGSTMMIPVTDDGKIILVNQYRYLNERESIEFPCGGVKEGESYLSSAQIELREETGFCSDELTFLGKFNPFNGVTDEYCFLYIAKKLKPSPLNGDISEDITTMFVTPVELQKLIEDNSIWDGMTLAAWSVARKYFFG